MHALAQRFLSAQLAGARREALAVIEEAFAGGMSVPEVHARIIRDAQHAVGDMWAANKISIAQEHVATAVASLALSWIYPRLPREPDKGKRIVVACVQGELHELGARIASDSLEMAGFEVRYLGANVPTDSLIALVAAERPDLVALAVTMPFHEEALREAVERLRAEFPSLRVIAGGYALEGTPEIADAIGVRHVGADAERFVRAAAETLGVA